MSADPFNFGPPNASQPPPPGGQPPGGRGNPFTSPAPDTPFTSPAPAAPGSPVHSSQPGMFGGATAPPGDLVAAKPPTWLLFLAAALALVAGIIAIVVANPIVAVVCWLVAGPVAIGVLALFVVRDTFARSSGLYAAPAWVKPMHYAAIGLCLLCILAPALRIADWVGHL